MDTAAPRLGLATAIGYRQFHRDIGVNFQCNRWVQWIGPSAIDEVTELAAHADTYPELIDGFLALADRTRSEGRALAAAYYDRAAEFFLPATDPRRPAARQRFLETLRSIYGVTPDLVAFDSGFLPAYDLRPQRQVGPTVVMFGGFDSYIEEFLPMIASMVDAGRRIVMFEGPGQGGALEDFGLAMIPDWERPVAAVLDHYGLDDVAAVGISLGGGLVVRAAAFEPRISRVVAFDILDDEFEVIARQIGRFARIPLRALLLARARGIVNAIAGLASARRPVSEWGLQQGMHITGTATAYDFLRSTLAVNTRKISGRIRADVLLLAGADDHYVPLAQLGRQAASLVNARSVTTRVFTSAEQASNHCQIGNIAVVSRLIDGWLDGLLVDGDAATGATSVRALAARAPIA